MRNNFYFLNHSSISFAIHFPPSPKAIPKAIVIVVIKPRKRALIIKSSTILIQFNIIISVKNMMMIFAPIAIIFDVLSLVSSSAWQIISCTEFAKRTPKYPIKTHTKRLGRQARRSCINCSTSVTPTMTTAHLKKRRNI